MPQVFGVSHMGYLYLLVSTLALYLTIFEVWESRWFFFLLLWVSLAFGLVSCGFFRFFGVSEDIIGKRKDGTLPLWSMVLFFPWLLPVNIVWHLSCLYHSRFENTFDEVFEGLFSFKFLILKDILDPDRLVFKEFMLDEDQEVLLISLKTLLWLLI